MSISKFPPKAFLKITLPDGSQHEKYVTSDSDLDFIKEAINMIFGMGKQLQIEVVLTEATISMGAIQ